jgi:hypothetical protein
MLQTQISSIAMRVPSSSLGKRISDHCQISVTKMLFYSSDMQSLFDPVMDEVIRLVSQQAEVGERMSGRKLDVYTPYLLWNEFGGFQVTNLPSDLSSSAVLETQTISTQR